MATRRNNDRLEHRGRRVGKKRNGTLEVGYICDGQLRIIAETAPNGISKFISANSLKGHSPNLGTLLCHSHHSVRNIFFQIDKCLDAGGSWDKESLECLFE